MNRPSAGYLLGIGSNIEPNLNIAQIIRRLLDHFSQLTLSRILKIPPIGMNSQRDFLNIVVFIESDISQTALKNICNDIEIELGRDRTDPTRKTKDRPADLDILTKMNLPEDYNRPIRDITDEYFLYPLLEEIIAYLSQSYFSTQHTGVEITIDDLTFGQTATTIHRNTSPGNKRVI